METLRGMHEKRVNINLTYIRFRKPVPKELEINISVDSANNGSSLKFVIKRIMRQGQPEDPPENCWSAEEKWHGLPTKSWKL